RLSKASGPEASPEITSTQENSYASKAQEEKGISQGRRDENQAHQAAAQTNPQGGPGLPDRQDRPAVHSRPHIRAEKRALQITPGSFLGRLAVRPGPRGVRDEPRGQDDAPGSGCAGRAASAGLPASPGGGVRCATAPVWQKAIRRGVPEERT